MIIECRCIHHSTSEYIYVIYAVLDSTWLIACDLYGYNFEASTLRMPKPMTMPYSIHFHSVVQMFDVAFGRKITWNNNHFNDMEYNSRSKDLINKLVRCHHSDNIVNREVCRHIRQDPYETDNTALIKVKCGLRHSQCLSSSVVSFHFLFRVRIYNLQLIGACPTLYKLHT